MLLKIVLFISQSSNAKPGHCTSSKSIFTAKINYIKMIKITVGFAVIHFLSSCHSLIIPS